MSRNQATGPVLLITGGARGIGAATARLAASRGYRLAINYSRSKARALALAQEIVESGGQARAYCADVTDEIAVSTMFEAITGELGPVTTLVNNAGVDGNAGPVQDLVATAVRRLFDVNVIGTMICCREAARHMSTHRGGSGGVIVNVSSMAATIGGRDGNAVYAASKAAIDAYTVGLAKELGPQGIRINTIRPGMTNTEMTAEAMSEPDRFAAVAATIPIGRFAHVDEIAAPIMWLLSDEASFISGARIDASGGGFIVR
ncbi:MAG TPA: SDR family oxidoreductase [Bradyrhizobium sp.]|nr:SDR family oxidoreductase [Bradyrhizobium sp.]